MYTWLTRSFTTLHDRHWNVCVLRFATAIKPHRSHTCTCQHTVRVRVQEQTLLQQLCRSVCNDAEPHQSQTVHKTHNIMHSSRDRPQPTTLTTTQTRTTHKPLAHVSRIQRRTSRAPFLQTVNHPHVTVPPTAGASTSSAALGTVSGSCRPPCVLNAATHNTRHGTTPAQQPLMTNKC